MKERNDCKIIQDLLPNYIEGLTDEETNTYIEEHLISCKQCKEDFDNMKSDLQISNEKRDKREVKYIKKFSNKMRIFKIIIAIILFIFAFSTGSKIYIISSLKQKNQEYITSKNYHYTNYSQQERQVNVGDFYVLGNRVKGIIYTVIDGKLIKNQFYINNDGTTNTYIERENEKIAYINQRSFTSINITDALECESKLGEILSTIPASIKSKKYNDKDCYYISNLGNAYFTLGDGIYIEKETGLTLGIFGGKDGLGNIEYVYEFNTVTEEDFVEPDISEYKVVSK